MHQNILNVLHRWLTEAGYDVNPKDVAHFFLSHPDVGTLSSITDTLNEFHILNQAAHIDADNITQLTEPLLAYIQTDTTEQFVLVRILSNVEIEMYNGNEKPFHISTATFLQLFSGIVVVIDQKTKKTTIQLKHLRTSSIILFVAIACMFLYWQHLSLHMHTLALFLSSILGLGLSILLFKHSTGAVSDLVKRFCSFSKNTDCSAVLLSSSAKIGKHINLTDVGVMYFSFQCLLLLVEKNDLSLLYSISIVVAAFPFYSIYQQAIVIKKWCPLCLGVVATLLFQGIWAIAQVSDIHVEAKSIVAAICVSGLTVIFWYQIKKSFERGNILKSIQTELFGFKRNYHLFLPFYKLANPVNDLLLKKNKEIIIGRQEAPVQITLITNPLCPACQNSHTVLTSLLQQYPGNVSVRIVFYVPYQNTQDPRTMIAAWLTNSFLKNKKEGIDTIDRWYANPDIKEFYAHKIPVETIIKQNDYLKVHTEWCVQQRLTLTPLLLINNKLFPLVYRTEDLMFHIEAISTYEQEEEDKLSTSVQSKSVLVDNT